MCGQDTRGIEAGVLIVGAGPTGLTLGVELARRGVPFLLVERDLTPPETSRAIVLQTRSVEMLRLLGIPRSELHPALHPRAFCLEEGARTLACVPFDPPDSGGVTMTVIDETDTERILAARLAALGGQVTRGVEFLTYRVEGDGIVATLRDASGEREVRARYLVGADGAHSTVRRLAGIPFEGAAYPEHFVLADLDLDWALTHDAAHVWIGGPQLAAVLPLPAPERYRVVLPLASATELPTAATEAELGDLAVSLLRQRTGLPLRVRGAPIWASTFRIARRQAASYRAGPVFLAGDAAHVHSPVGGQGMNTGLQDACNLGWKLALAAQGLAAPGLLDTYQAERAPIAHRLLRNTDLATRAVLAQNGVMREMRRYVIPRLIGASPVRERLLSLLGQLDINYRGSFLAVDALASDRHSGGLRPGDRVPDAILHDADGTPLHLADLIAGGWVLLLFPGSTATPERLQAAQALAAVSRATVGDAVRPVLILDTSAASGSGLAALRDATGELPARFGAGRGVAALIRPDGYLGFLSGLEDVGALASYLARVFAMRMVA